jgi:hypothetical protein
MDEVESLSSILGDTPFSTGEPVAPAPDPTPPVAEPNVEAPVAETTSTPTRDESGRFAKVEEPKVEAKPELTKADVAAIIDERRKRQELQRELDQLKQQQPQKPKTDIFADPDAAIAERLQERLTPLENTIFQLQTELAKSKMPDFDDAAKAFFTHAQNDPILMHQADTAPDLFAFIYREGNRLKELGDVGGDIVKYKEKVTAESRAEIAKRDEQIATLSKQIETLTKAQAELAAVPRSLNQLGTSVPKSTDADPEDINQLVRFKAG